MTLSPFDAIVAQYTGLITSWLNSMIRRELKSSIDIEQLVLMILDELIRHLRKTRSDVPAHEEIVRICRTITNHRVIDAVRFAERRKRMIPTQNDLRVDLEILQERDESKRSDYQVELDDFIAVLEAALEHTLREVVERKRLGCTNQQIASDLHVSIRTIQSRLKKIEIAVVALLKTSYQLSILNRRF